jgi:hypothetical protein
MKSSSSASWRPRRRGFYNLDTNALGLVTGNCYRIDVSVNGAQIANAFAVFQPTK